MKRLMFIPIIFIPFHPGFCATKNEDLIYVQTSEFPSVIRIKQNERAELEKSISGLEENKRKWKKYANLKISYVIEQHTKSLVAPPVCANLPIRVTLASGNPVSVIYASSDEKCKEGDAVSQHAINEYQLLISPADLFGRIEKAKEQLSCYSNATKECRQSSLSVVYDNKYGLPVEMTNGSALVMDDGWSLKVSHLQMSK